MAKIPKKGVVVYSPNFMKFVPTTVVRHNRYRTYLTIEIDILARNMREAERIKQNLDFGNLRNSAGEAVEWGIIENKEKLRRLSHG